jgi:ubiquinone/menaquinone biosynthesis C-methylase UbiE
MKFEHLKMNWESLGRDDPLWAILSDDTKKGGGWDVGEFYSSGVAFIDWWLQAIEKIDAVPVSGRALDFGCGAGRLTQGLSKHFEQVVGVDIAASMIEIARKHNPHDNCLYVVNDRPDLSQFETDSFDFVITVIVLQHMQNDYAFAYLEEFLRILKPGGILFFQLPTSPKERTREYYTKEGIPYEEENPSFEVYGVEQHEVQEYIQSRGGRIVSVTANDWAGPEWDSLHYVIRKGAS